eukprot:985164-Pelagomonas_calceolata.AAC.2
MSPIDQPERVMHAHLTSSASSSPRGTGSGAAAVDPVHEEHKIMSLNSWRPLCLMLEEREKARSPLLLPQHPIKIFQELVYSVVFGSLLHPEGNACTAP